MDWKRRPKYPQINQLDQYCKLSGFNKTTTIPAIFIESSVNPGAIEEIANECKVKVGKLFSDALGPKDHNSIVPDGRLFTANTWAGMMVHNVSTIVNGLCQNR